MPANLSPEYKAADAAFRKARDPGERLECLREMLRTIPKHKGTEKLQADIKARIKSLADEFEGGARKGGGHGGPALVIRPEGAAQIALLGPPNSGKSSLHARLTGSEAHVASYAFTTQYPQPGMMAFEDIHLQLVDLPAISREHPVPWLAAALQMADAALLVMDLGDADCIDELRQAESILHERGVTLVERWDGADAPSDDDPFAMRIPAMLLANKCDLLAAADEEIDAFRELSGEPYPVMKVSAATGEGLDALGRWLFEHLGIVRVYTKAPGHAFEKTKPFTLRRGQTVSDVARLVHKDIERSFRYARIWGGHSEFEGQQVGPNHALSDGDIVELHN